MDTKSKLDIATQKKQSGDQAFKAGDMPAGQPLIELRFLWPRAHVLRLSALRNYHEVHCSYGSYING